LITITNQKPLLKALAVAVNFIEAYIRTQTTHMGNVSYVKKKELALILGAKKELERAYHWINKELKKKHKIVSVKEINKGENNDKTGRSNKK
jgi:hypothetical protein